MTERVEALVQPELLRWARETAGFDHAGAAKKAGVKPERLESWEGGERRPTIKQLRTLSKVYRRPIALFYLPEPPEGIDPPKDFRRLPGQVAGTASPDLRFEVRRAVLRREVALELFDLEGDEPPVVGASIELDQSAADAGSQIRKLLGVRVDQQFSWRGAYESFNSWRAAVERAGVLVLQMTEVELSEARGFSISDTPLPVIVANIKDSPNGRVFTLLHEFAHVLLRDGGLCDLNDVTARPPELLRVEQYCNSVAGAALVPAALLAREPAIAQHGDSEVWSDDDLTNIARRFGVSQEVVLRRLLDMGRTTPAFYAQKRDEFLEAYEEYRREQSGGFAPPHQVALASAGPAFAGLVLSSYADGLITASDLSDYLGVRLKHLPRIQEQLVGHRSR